MTKTTSSNVILVTACVMFFALGFLTAALGPLMAEFAQRNNVPIAAVGGIFSAVFMGALFSQVLSGWLGDRIGEKPLLVGSSFILALSLVGMGASRWLPLTLGLALFAGLGHGAVDLCANVLIARLFSRRGVSALNLLNLFFGLGAFTGPAVVSLGQHLWQSGLIALWFGSALISLAAYMMLRMSPEYDILRSTEKPAFGSLYRSPMLWAIGLLVLVYVGTENAMGGWTTTYLQRTSGLMFEQASMATAGFWLALTAGRMLSVILGARLQAHQVLLVSLVEALAGSTLFVLSRGQAFWSVASVLLIGFGFGAIFPTALAITTRSFPDAPGKAGSVVAAMGSIGGMLLPWSLGILLAKWGTRAAALFILSAVVVMTWLYIFSRRRNSRCSDLVIQCVDG